jgi:hypothetical protein
MADHLIPDIRFPEISYPECDFLYCYRVEECTHARCCVDQQGRKNFHGVSPQSSQPFNVDSN